MSLPPSSKFVHPKEITSGIRSPESKGASTSNTLPVDSRQPVLESRQLTGNPLRISDLRIVISTSSSGSSAPILNARKNVQIEDDDEELVKRQLTPEMRSVFKNIQSGELKFFDLVPGKRFERHTHGIDLDLVHPKTLHTPLTMALQNGQIGIAVCLLVLGADPLALDGHEKPPSDYATPLCKMFLRFFNLRRQPAVRIDNTDPRDRFLQLLNAQDAGTGETMLSRAVMQRQDKMAALLISEGADFASRNAKGLAPLEVAARCGSLQIVRAMLDVWPQLASRPKLPYLKQAIMGAVETDRPAVLACLLSFFCAEFRANEADEGNEDRDSIDLHEVIPRNTQTEEDALEFFMKAKLPPALTVQQLMHRTSDNCLLTEHECWLLGLDRAELLAKQKGHQRILELFAARTLPRS